MNFPIIISIKSTSLSKQEKNFILKIKPFGVIIFTRNISNIPQISKLNQSIKSLSKNTLIFIDQEGGIVNRFKKFKEFNFLDNFELYKIYLRYPSLSKQLVFLKSFITSYYLKKLNFDVNTVPVLDLPIKNTILMIKKRTFGPNFNINIILQKILLYNLNYFGLIPIMKHIPGHGVTNKDSHLTMPISKLDKVSLQDHIKVFKYFNNIPLAMTAHIKYLSWDKNNIATFSNYIIDNIIRKKIGFKGLLISDDLKMNANIYNIKDAVRLSNFSNLDVILDCSCDLHKYSQIINSFNFSKNYINTYKSNKLQEYKKKLDFKSININHYHQLYNQLLKINGF